MTVESASEGAFNCAVLQQDWSPKDYQLWFLARL